MSTNLLVWIILAPLLGAILNGGLYFYNIKKQKISENYFAIIGTLTPLISFLITLSLFLRMIEEIEEVKVSSLKLTGDLNKDSKSLTKIDKTAQVEKAVGIPGPPEKPREKPAEFKKDVLYSLLSLSVKPQAIMI